MTSVRYPRKSGTARVALGDTWDTVKSISGAVDPYLPEALCRIDQIRALRNERTPLQVLFGKRPTVAIPACARVRDDLPGGIGVERAIKPLRAAVYVYENPASVWLGAAAVFMVPFLIGYAVGKKK